MNKEKLINALETAIKMEKNGYDFYKQTAEKSKNNITRKTFNFLADNELLHIESIKKFTDDLRKNGELIGIDLTSVKPDRQEKLSVFSRTITELSEKVHSSDDDKKACEFAMQLEKDGYKFYKDMLSQTTDEKLKGFLKFLLGEENAHYEGIMKLYEYITDTKNWFMYEEKSFPQG